jgi:hypothetical protein
MLRLLNQGLEIIKLKSNVFLGGGGGLLGSLKGLTPKGKGPNVGVLVHLGRGQETSPRQLPLHLVSSRNLWFCKRAWCKLLAYAPLRRQSLKGENLISPLVANNLCHSYDSRLLRPPQSFSTSFIIIIIINLLIYNNF